MDWNAENIRQLRYRLGWSCAEMARNLNLGLDTVMAWEAGRVNPEVEHCNSLLRIFHHAENNAERVSRRPIAEVIMRDRGLSQIHDFDVIDSLDPLADGAPVKGHA